MTATATSATRQIARAASLVIVLFFFSRVTGLAREMIIGARFGTTAEYDAYLAAFRVPDMIFYLVAGGALGSAFIPVFTGCLTRRQLTGAWRLFSAVQQPGVDHDDGRGRRGGIARPVVGPHGPGARLCPLAAGAYG